MNPEYQNTKTVAESMREKWKFIRYIGEGGHGSIFVIQERASGQEFVMKEDKLSSLNTLENELVVYNAAIAANMSGGFATINSVGICNDKKFIIMSKLEFGRAGVRLIEKLHGLGFVHNDIKPDNFVFGPPDGIFAKDIYMIDFGVAKPFLRECEGVAVHIPFTKRERYPGTKLFGSFRANRYQSSSRRDDLESLMYCIVYLATGTLPWEDHCDPRIPVHKYYIEVAKMKENCYIPEMFKGLPSQVFSCLHQIKELEFEQRPDYNSIVNLLTDTTNEVLAKGSADGG